MSEEERVRYFLDSLMKAVGEGVRIGETTAGDDESAIEADINCVEGECVDCTRCIIDDRV